jgi:anti-anti-sigma factor
VPDPAQSRLEIRNPRVADVRLLGLVGELVVDTAARLEAELNAAAADAEDVVLDLSQISFMDSTGLRAIVAGRELITASGRTMALVLRPGGQVDGLLEMVELKPSFLLAASQEEAIDAVRDRRPQV